MPIHAIFATLLLLVLTACGPSRPDPTATVAPAQLPTALENRPQWPLEVIVGKLKIDAGGLHGFWPGLILAVSPSETAPDSAIAGYLRITQVGLFSSEAEMIDYAGKPALRARLIPADAYARTLGNVIPAPLSYTIRGAEATEKLVRELKAIGDNPESGVAPRRAASEQQSDFDLIAETHGVWIVRSGEPLVRSGPLRHPFADWGHLASELRRVGNSHWLVTQAMRGPDQSSLDSDIALQVLRAPNDPIGQDEVALFHNGDPIGFRAVNNSKRPVDVTLLLVDGRYHITTVLPVTGTGSRIPAGKNIGFMASVDTASGAGLEHAILISVRTSEAVPALHFPELATGFLARDSGPVPRLAIQAMQWRTTP